MIELKAFVDEELSTINLLKRQEIDLRNIRKSLLDDKGI
jgi:hypothetical protein